jgi:hypothetical protein
MKLPKGARSAIGTPLMYALTWMPTWYGTYVTTLDGFRVEVSDPTADNRSVQTSPIDVPGGTLYHPNLVAALADLGWEAIW